MGGCCPGDAVPGGLDAVQGGGTVQGVGGAVQGGVVLSITGSDIINPPCKQND